MEEKRQTEREEAGYTPASFEKRTAAWMGIVYMLMLVFLITFTMATGMTLPGTAPLLLVPVGVALLVIQIYRLRRGVISGGLPVFVCVVCVIAVVLGLWLGVPALLQGLAQPRPVL